MTPETNTCFDFYEPTIEDTTPFIEAAMRLRAGGEVEYERLRKEGEELLGELGNYFKSSRPPIM